jgi:hypothetical protein
MECRYPSRPRAHPGEQLPNVCIEILTRRFGLICVAGFVGFFGFDKLFEFGFDARNDFAQGCTHNAN